MTTNTFASRFAPRDKVTIDGCADLIVTVTAILWRSENPLVECSWVAGSAQTAWVEEWRLEPVVEGAT